jgi:hypothetical protein
MLDHTLFLNITHTLTFFQGRIHSHGSAFFLQEDTYHLSAYSLAFHVPGLIIFRQTETEQRSQTGLTFKFPRQETKTVSPGAATLGGFRGDTGPGGIEGQSVAQWTMDFALFRV